MEANELLPFAAGLAGGAVAGWVTAKTYVHTLLTKTYAGKIEKIVEAAAAGDKLRAKTPIHVLGEGLWPQLRQQGFLAARPVLFEEISQLAAEAVLVVEGLAFPDLSTATCVWFLVVWEKRELFSGSLPAGAQFTYANSRGITLDARLMELLRARAAWEKAIA